MRRHNSGLGSKARVRFSILLALSMVTLLSSGCAVLKIQVREKPFQGEWTYHYNEYQEHRPIRPYQAVRETRYLWGLYSYVSTPPVDYHYFERRDLGCRAVNLFLTELQKNVFSVAQPPYGTYATDVLKRVGIIEKPGIETENDVPRNTSEQKDRRILRNGEVEGRRPSVERLWKLPESSRNPTTETTDRSPSTTDYQNDTGANINDNGGNRKNNPYLMPLESTMSCYTVPLFRLLTLGLFWDTGYVADDQVWGKSNRVLNRAWFGKAEFIVVQDGDGNFHTRRMTFDPSHTVRLAGRLAAKAGKLYLQKEVAASLMLTPPVGNPNDSAYQNELRRYGALKAKQDRLDLLRLSLEKGPLDKASGERGLTDLDTKTRTVLTAVLQSYGQIKVPLAAGEGCVAQKACVPLTKEQMESGAFTPSDTFP